MLYNKMIIIQWAWWLRDLFQQELLLKHPSGSEHDKQIGGEEAPVRESSESAEALAEKQQQTQTKAAKKRAKKTAR